MLLTQTPLRSERLELRHGDVDRLVVVVGRSLVGVDRRDVDERHVEHRGDRAGP